MPARPAAPPGCSCAPKRWLVGRADQLQGCFDRSERCSTRRPAAIVGKDLVLFRHDHAHPLTVSLPHAQGLGAAFLGRRAGLPPRAEAARSQAGLGHGWSACVVAGLIVGLQARVSPRQILQRTLGHASYTHGARIPRLCGLWGPLPAAWQRDGAARYPPVCMGYPRSKAKSAGVE